MKSVPIILFFAVVDIYADRPIPDEFRIPCLQALEVDSTRLEELFFQSQNNPRMKATFEEYFPKEKQACVMSCILRKYRNIDPYDYILGKIPQDDKERDDEDRIALKKLNNCREQVGESGCQLLKCFEIWDQPRFLNNL